MLREFEVFKNIEDLEKVRVKKLTVKVRENPEFERKGPVEMVRKQEQGSGI